MPITYNIILCIYVRMWIQREVLNVTAQPSAGLELASGAPATPHFPQWHSLPCVMLSNLSSVFLILSSA